MKKVILGVIALSSLGIMSFTTLDQLPPDDIVVKVCDEEATKNGKEFDMTFEEEYAWFEKCLAANE